MRVVPGGDMLQGFGNRRPYSIHPVDAAAICLYWRVMMEIIRTVGIETAVGMHRPFSCLRPIFPTLFQGTTYI